MDLEVLLMNIIKNRRLAVNKSIFPIGLLLALSLILQACSSGTGLAEGDQAPDFVLPSSIGAEVSLSEVNSDKPVLLYFHMALG